MSKKNIITLASILITAIVSWHVFANSDKDESPKPSNLSGPPPAEVAVISIEPTSLDITEKLPGRTTAFRIAQIRPQVSGIVLERLFKEGGDVKKGDQLYQLDDSSFVAAVDRADANLRNAKVNAAAVKRRANRFEELIETKAISQQDYDDVRTALEQAEASVAIEEAALKTAKLNLAYTRVYAPISGRIGRSQVTEGALVTANQAETMTVITQLDPIYVDVTQSTTDNMRLRQTAISQEKIKVEIDHASFADSYPHVGELQFSDVLVDETTGSVQLRAIFPNPDHHLLPGLFVNTFLHLGHKQVILIPQQSVSRDPLGNAFVWKVSAENSVSQVPVKTARAIGNQWLISEGLEEGDTIVVQGFQRITPGSTVTPIKLQK